MVSPGSAKAHQRLALLSPPPGDPRAASGRFCPAVQNRDHVQNMCHECMVNPGFEGLKMFEGCPAIFTEDMLIIDDDS